MDLRKRENCPRGYQSGLSPYTRYSMTGLVIVDSAVLERYMPIQVNDYVIVKIKT